MTSGPLAFARFALPPNALGYCGTPDHDALAGHARSGVDDRELRELCRSFEGAWPYLELIAGASGVPDPLDPRVVEAYWIGNGLLEDVRARPFGDHLDARFRARTANGEWRWLADKPAAGAVPHHSFHVLEVMPRIGMLRAGQVQAILPAMASCLVRPARVVERAPDGTLTVMARQLELADGRYRLGEPGLEHLAASSDETPGDPIAVHWGWSCGRLASAQASALGRTLESAVLLANRTV